MARKQHSSKILEFATKLGSREAGFVFALFGVLSQVVHTWFITMELSSLSGWIRFVQSGVMSVFLNGGLLYFILKGTSEDEKTAKRYRRLVIGFACLEAAINLYYWSYKYMISTWPTIDWGHMIIAIPFAIMLPVVLSCYSYEIRVDDYSDVDEDEQPIANTQLDELVNKVVSSNQQFTSEEVEQIRRKIAEAGSDALLKGLISNDDTVDLEFTWTNNDDKIEQRVLPNVKLVKSSNNIPSNPIETSPKSDLELVEDISINDVEKAPTTESPEEIAQEFDKMHDLQEPIASQTQEQSQSQTQEPTPDQASEPTSEQSLEQKQETILDY